MAEKSKLIRAVGRWDLTALSINGVIGAGIFGLPASVAALTGPWSPLACLLCAAIVLFIVLCFAEVSSLFSSTGGPYLYAREAFGDPLALAAGWMMWLARVTAFAANANLMVSFIGYFFPFVRTSFPRAVLLAAIVSLLTWINVRGVRIGAIVGDVLAATKLLPMAFFVLAGVFFISPSNFVQRSEIAYSDFGQALLLFVYAFTGFEFAAIPAGEATAPKKHLPAAMLTALGVAAILYTGIQLVCVGTLPDLAGSQTAMADASRQFLGPIGGQLIALTAIASISGNLSGICLVSPRLTYALSQDRLLPSMLSRVHAKYHTPYVSICLFGVLTLGLGLSGTFVGLAKISAVARIIPYATTCLSVLRLRKKFPSEPDRFLIRGGRWVPLAAFGLCALLAAQSKPGDALAAGAALGLGYVLFGLTRRFRQFR